MARNSDPVNAGSRPQTPLRRLGKIALLAVAALVVLYFAVTSGPFLKAVVLPRVGKTLGAKVVASEISLSPFSKLHLKQVKVTTTGANPVFAADEVLVRYRLGALLRGDLIVPQISLVAPKFDVVLQPDGTSNLDPLLARPTATTTAPPRTEPLQLRIDRLQVTQATLRCSRVQPNQASEISEITNLDLTVENLQNDAEARISLSAALGHTAVAGTGDTNRAGQIAAKLTSALTLGLQRDLQPRVVKGDIKMNVERAEGAFLELGGLNGTVDCDLTPTEVRELAMRFTRAGESLGQIRLSGPLELDRSEARVRFDVTAIDRRVLNLVGAPFGLDFADTTLSASGVIGASRLGEAVTANGKLSLGRFSVRQGERRFPPLDLDLEYQVSADLKEETAVVQKLQLTGRQEGRELLTGRLDRPMRLAWSQASPHGLNESVVQLALTNLNLADWRMLLPTNAPAALVSARCSLTVQQDGKRILAELNAGVRDLEIAFGTNRVSQGALDLEARGQFRDYRSLLVDQYSLVATERDTRLFTASGSANYDLASADANLQVNLVAEIPNLLKEHPVPGLVVSTGRLDLSALLGSERAQQKVSVNLTLDNFNGGYGEYQFRNYQVRFEADGDWTDRLVNVRRVSFTSRQGTDNGGSVDLGGKYDRIQEIGEFDLNVVDLNQSGLQPILAPLLAPRGLISGSINGGGHVVYSPKNDNRLQLQAKIDRLLFRDPTGALPNTPIDLAFQCEVLRRTNQYEIRTASLSLPPTPRATNQVTLRGVVDLSPTNPAPSALALHAESLDFTPWFNFYVTNTTPATAVATAASPAPAAEEEPPPVELPVSQLNLDLKVGRLHLNELALSNWVATAKLDRGNLRVQPCNLVFNGAPVAAEATVDLTKPGYVYDFTLKAEHVPIEPMVVTFAPERAGQFKGDLSAHAQFKGAGITGTNLQRHLTGKFDVGSTNLQLALADVRMPLLKTLINVVLSLPELSRNPAAVVGNLVNRLKSGGNGSSSPAWVDQFARSPIETISLTGSAGNGQIELQEAKVQSAAFHAQGAGTIRLAPVLTNSPLEIPVAIALRRPLAEGVSLVPAGTPTNEVFVKLPDFYTQRGTLGEPKADIKKTVLVALAARAGAGLISNTGNADLNKAAGVLDAVGNLLGGKTTPAAPTNAAGTGSLTNLLAPKSTSPPGSQPSSSGNLLDLLKKN